MSGNVVIMGHVPTEIKETIEAALQQHGIKPEPAALPKPAPMDVNLGAVGQSVDFDKLPRQTRREIQRRYKKELRKPENKTKTGEELMQLVGKKMNINFQIETP